jgi:translation initiation factor IF-2
MGKQIEEATFSSPIHVIGFSSTCSSGNTFRVYADKRSAEEAVAQAEPEGYTTPLPENLESETTIIPVIVKCDVIGMIEAIAGEIEKLSGDGIFFKIIKSGVGDINESDIQVASTDTGTIILGFNVKEDKRISHSQEYEHVLIKNFSIIYKISEWLAEIKEARRYKKQVEVVSGIGKILKIFSLSKKGHVIGVRIKEGVLNIGDAIHILRHDEHIAKGIITEIQVGKIPTKRVDEDTECGMRIETNIDVIEGDQLEAFTIRTE